VFVGVLQIELSIPGAFSLKDKRSVVKGLLERLRRQFGVSAAEVDALDTWNRAGLGISFVANERRRAESQLQQVLNALERESDAIVENAQIEVF
jgi:uncharacterized protein YlxP (DUF503 family)